MEQIKNYLTYFIGIFMIGIFMKEFRGFFEEQENKKALETLQDYFNHEFSVSDIKKSSKPLLWVHIPFERNARHWLDFNTRNTNRLNQPYIFFCLKSIIDNCGEDFQIVFVDNSSFSRLLKEWNIEINDKPEPIKGRLTQLAMHKILHEYGGITLPHSFFCLRSLKTLFTDILSNHDVFATKRASSNIVRDDVFVNDDRIIGCNRGSNILSDIIKDMEKMLSTDYTHDFDLSGKSSSLYDNPFIFSVNPALFGVVDESNEIIHSEDLIGHTKPIDFHSQCFGFTIDADFFLNKRKYEWFTRMSLEQVLESNTNIAKIIIENS